MYQKFGQQAINSPISLFITYTLHPLPDRDRSRVANAVSGLNSTTRACHSTSHRQGLTSQRHLARRGEATVAGPNALARKYPGGVASNLAVLGGNDPHSYGVTSRRASMNTLRPKNYYKVLSADLSIM